MIDIIETVGEQNLFYQLDPSIKKKTREKRLETIKKAASLVFNQTCIKYMCVCVYIYIWYIYSVELQLLNIICSKIMFDD